MENTQIKQSTNNNLANVVSLFDAITLDEMGDIQLMNRIDTKYVVPISSLCLLLQAAVPHYFILEMAGERQLPYHTVYLDTANKDMYHAHHGGKTARQKIRIRTYESSCQTFLEVKDKDNHGRTDKKRIAVAGEESWQTEESLRFLVRHACYPCLHLLPQIENHFFRITLVNRSMTERLTIDTRLCFHNLQNGVQVQMPQLAIVELKRSRRASSPMCGMMRQLRIQPTGFSKYCMGCAMTDTMLKQNRLKPKIHYVMKVIKQSIQIIS